MTDELANQVEADFGRGFVDDGLSANGLERRPEVVEEFRQDVVRQPEENRKRRQTRFAVVMGETPGDAQGEATGGGGGRGRRRRSRERRERGRRRRRRRSGEQSWIFLGKTGENSEEVGFISDCLDSGKDGVFDL